ncbi:MAG: hypothetical protein IAF38_06535, partial [Bacteroidia bacterium]|nr:hypothetical protein [Bacteroidia bacterium]
MKKLVVLFLGFISVFSASSQNITRMLGSSPFQDSLWIIDTSSFTVVRRIGPTPSTGGAFTGMNGIARNPLSGTIYVVNKQSAVSGRVLGTLNPLTGVVNIIGNLGDNFSSITFTSDGKLYGTVGDGGTALESLFQIDTATAAVRLVKTLGNGNDGEVICYDPSDNMLYHWSGNGTIVFEKFDTITGPYNFTNIPIIGTTNGETFGAVNIGPGKFITSNIGSSFNRFYSSGVVDPQFGSNPDDLRGLAFITCPRTISGPSGICIGSTATISAPAGAVSYQWYKAGVLLAGETNQTLVVSTT